ncbi:MAG: hypothetical protein ACI977_000047 [Candidatus Nanohaloarchaea archaeon]|jgi:hypothetical protein
MRISIYTVLLFVLGLTVIALVVGLVSSVIGDAGEDIDGTGSELNQGYDCFFQNPENPDQACDIGYDAESYEEYAV